MVGTSLDISLYGNNIEPSLYSTLLSTFGWLGFSPISHGSIGAFYFEPLNNEVVQIGTPLVISYIVNDPSIVTTLNVVTPIPAAAYYLVPPPTIINISDILVDFVGVPRVGASPLVVDFTASVTLGGGANGTFLVKEYHWYFDFDNNPTVYVVSTTPNITYVYPGYYGQQYSVKMCVVLK